MPATALGGRLRIAAAHLLIALPLFVLPGCQMNERLSGTVGGAVGQIPYL